MRQRFVRAAEGVMRDNGGTHLVLADVAARLGMSQANSYRYFPNRKALISLLAEQWFAEVESEVAAAVATQQQPEAQVLQWVLMTMRAKCVRFDADPALFIAYLNLAKGEHEAVARHVARLTDVIRPAVVVLVGQTKVGTALELLEDATLLFRNPYLIAQHRATLSEKRARNVTEAIVRSFR